MHFKSWMILFLMTEISFKLMQQYYSILSVTVIMSAAPYRLKCIIVSDNLLKHFEIINIANYVKKLEDTNKTSH